MPPESAAEVTAKPGPEETAAETPAATDAGVRPDAASPTLVRIVLGVSVLVLGGCGLAYEYVLGALGNHLMGSSHEQIFVVIGIMLFTMGLGAQAQQVFETKLFDRFLTVEVILGLVGGFSANAIHAAHTELEHYALVLYVLVALIGFLIGLEIPLILRLNAEYSRTLKNNLAEILSLDYLGALVGALVFTYVLLSRFSLPRIAFLLGLTNLTVALAGWWVFRGVLVHPKRALGLILAATAALGFGLTKSDDWTRAIEQRWYRDPIIFSETSRYQHLVMTRKRRSSASGQPRPARLNFYINGHLQFSSSDEHIYHELLVHPPMQIARSRRSVLVLGGGDGLAVREILRYPDVEEVLLVDLDPRMTELAREHPDLRALNEDSLRHATVKVVSGLKSTPDQSDGPPETRMAPRGVKTPLSKLESEPPMAEVEIRNLDADLFLDQVGARKFDVVIVDFPDPSKLELAKLYSTGFYNRLRLHVAEGGAIAVQSTSPFFARDAFLVIGATIRAGGFSALPYHAHVPSFGQWGFHLGWRDPRTAKDVKATLRRAETLPSSVRYLTAETIEASFVFGKDRLISPNPIQPSTRLAPTVLEAYRRGWEGSE